MWFQINTFSCYWWKRKNTEGKQCELSFSFFASEAFSDPKADRNINWTLKKEDGQDHKWETCELFSVAYFKSSNKKILLIDYIITTD